MNEELGLRIVFWLIVFTGSLAITSGLLYASLWLFGQILKMLGMWQDTIKIMSIYFREKNKKNEKS